MRKVKPRPPLPVKSGPHIFFETRDVPELSQLEPWLEPKAEIHRLLGLEPGSSPTRLNSSLPQLWGLESEPNLEVPGCRALKSTRTYVCSLVQIGYNAIRYSYKNGCTYHFEHRTNKLPCCCPLQWSHSRTTESFGVAYTWREKVCENLQSWVPVRQTSITYRQWKLLYVKGHKFYIASSSSRLVGIPPRPSVAPKRYLQK